MIITQMKRKGSITFTSFLSWLTTRMNHFSELNYTVENIGSGPQIKIIFKHDLGENWSIYHKIILDCLFYEMGEYTVGIEATWVHTFMRKKQKY